MGGIKKRKLVPIGKPMPIYAKHVLEDPCVYFVIADSVQMLKIGTATDMGKRLRDLSGSSPVPISVYGVIAGGEQVERWCHAHCFGERSHFEWFKWNAKTKAFVDWVLCHGRAAAEKICLREIKTDRLLFVGRQPITRLHALPGRRSDADWFFRIHEEHATPLGACECERCRDLPSPYWCGRP